MPLYMLDTDVSSYLMKGLLPSAVERIKTLHANDICISVITQGELIFSAATAANSRTKPMVERFLQYMQVMDLTAPICMAYGSIRADLKSQGKLIGANDLWIAAHARHLGLTLVTNNVREFSRVNGLKIENWAEPA
jgi:tRNA(fMet)-specific endonuclease VapC